MADQPQGFSLAQMLRSLSKSVYMAQEMADQMAVYRLQRMMDKNGDVSATTIRMQGGKLDMPHLLVAHMSTPVLDELRLETSASISRKEGDGHEHDSDDLMAHLSDYDVHSAREVKITATYKSQPASEAMHRLGDRLTENVKFDFGGDT